MHILVGHRKHYNMGTTSQGEGKLQLSLWSGPWTHNYA